MPFSPYHAHTQAVVAFGEVYPRGQLSPALEEQGLIQIQLGVTWSAKEQPVGSILGRIQSAFPLRHERQSQGISIPPVEGELSVLTHERRHRFPVISTTILSYQTPQTRQVVLRQTNHIQHGRSVQGRLIQLEGPARPVTLCLRVQVSPLSAQNQDCIPVLYPRQRQGIVRLDAVVLRDTGSKETDSWVPVIVARDVELHTVAQLSHDSSSNGLWRGEIAPGARVLGLSLEVDVVVGVTDLSQQEQQKQGKVPPVSKAHPSLPFPPQAVDGNHCQKIGRWQAAYGAQGLGCLPLQGEDPGT